MSCLYYPTSLSYITSKQPLLLDDTSRQKKPQNIHGKNDQGSRLGLSLMCKQDEDILLSAKKLKSPLNLRFPVPGDNYSISQKIHQSSVSSETDNTSLVTTSSTANPRKSLSTNNTDYDDLYDVSSNEDVKEKRNSDQKIKAQKHPKKFDSPQVSNGKTKGPETQPLLRPVNTTAHIVTESQYTKPKFPNNLRFDRTAESSSSNTSAFYSGSGGNGDDWNGGVQLHPDAMATLRAISQDHDISLESFENFCDLTPREKVIPEMKQIRHQTTRNFDREKPKISVPSHRKSASHLISLDIPSPKRFLVANLSPGTRHTWHFDSPSSTTAEHFYRFPSLQSPKINESDSPSVGLQNNSSLINPPRIQKPETVYSDYQNISCVTRPCHEEISNLGLHLNKTDDIETEIDRTSSWVANQRSILSRPSSPRREILNCSENLENVYYCAFQYLISHSSNQDTFIQRVPRYEAIQSQRVSFPATNRAQLLGKYSLSDFPLSAKSQLLSYLNTDIEITPEDFRRLKRDLEDEAIRQISLATWTFMAVKFLYGGHLLPTPITNYLSSLNAKASDQVQILDLGGQEVCGWAWHCAVEFPESQVYTVTPKSLQLSDSKISGPENHHNLVVDSFVRFPFQDNQFDLISARSLYSILKLQTENGIDEWDDCLEECFRMLKPGGYIEFDIIDSEIISPGPLGFAKGSEFNTNLKLLGFDSQPTKCWLARLKRSLFVDIRRTWLILPMGGCENNQVLETDGTIVEAESKLDAKFSGSTTEMAPICGLIGSWAWERWLLRYKMLTGGIGESFEGIEAIILEGSKCGAGWKSLNGWARKPSHF
ncbi:putative methyltransferase domain-containing protein [Erysiphe neolycopersici]|uniref:Putative methyltransferase domain-containing protein n=1 Tax=Erysiphe neolycopersici TaxID=212602 RepID=A0A420HW71_9PEZI|nr:putative methyltransferase domain-containing protein [Erysiphe neolycopersici]